MIVNIKGEDVETKDIISIKDAGFRMHGFYVHLIGGRKILVGERQAYEMTLSELKTINHSYKRIEERLRGYWHQDKRNVPVID